MATHWNATQRVMGEVLQRDERPPSGGRVIRPSAILKGVAS